MAPPPGLEDFATTRQPIAVPPEFYMRKRLPAGRKPDDRGLGEQDVVCPRCHKGNSARRHFCRHCGESLPVAPVDVVIASPVHEHWWRRLLRRVLPRKKVEAPDADSAGEAGRSAPGPADTPKPGLPSTATPAMRPKEPGIPAVTAPPHFGTVRVPTLPKPANAHLPSARLLGGRTVAILVAAGAILLLGGSQLALHGLRGEFNRVRSFFYPRYGLIPVRSDLATNLEGCSAPRTVPAVAT